MKMTFIAARYQNNNLQSQGSAHQLPAIVAAPEERYLPFPLTDIQQVYWAGRLEGVELGAMRLTATSKSTATDWTRSASTLPGSDWLIATTCCGRSCRPTVNNAF